jgi:hypothetical protein
MKLRWPLVCLGFVASSAVGQIQVELKFPRLQYIAYEPVVANLVITNLAGRDVELHDAEGQHWFGFEVTRGEGTSIAPIFAVHDFGTYRVRAHVYFADLNKFFYSQTKVFEVTKARPIWQKTVGVPDDTAGSARTYSLMTNRFLDHTSLYICVEDKDSGIVYATYSLGQIIAFDQPQAEFDRANQLHVLYCAAPRTWSYARVGLNGELVSRATFAESKTRPRLVHSEDGVIKVAGGMIGTPVTQTTRDNAPKLSARPPNAPKDD